MAVSFSPYAAYNARVSFNTHGVELILVARKWTVNVKTVDIDASNFEGVGYVEQITSVVGADVSLEFLYDKNLLIANNLGATQIVPTMVAASGYDIEGVRLYVNSSAAPASFFLFPFLTEVSISCDADVHNALVMTLTGKSDSSFTYPT